ncbi:hypothetical protein PPL_10285 [Heterostelium album PN500]|uniref:RING-type domain-containing protein n=1 Tax=Heterostelium pallidum (strain ATCC 26659 / Pp 5 / PN500) TaxID=670386 RepID=D3BQU7_HETP5|nr:hypothetical protein PPL_10285 [Heterostelium album PN500]EFA76517.1 hypothetical protein PPL_10285 [Heterostelium album PN500]|eukprot:XP_020428649.1 hypothetical protein PPL_10285 [Heterostelium album PN500]
MTPSSTSTLKRNNTLPSLSASLSTSPTSPFSNVNKSDSDETTSTNINLNDILNNTTTTTTRSSTKIFDNNNNSSTTTTRNNSGQLYCPICQCIPVNGHVSLCGHVCCWDCWNQWLSLKLECPICREKTRLKQIKPVS